MLLSFDAADTPPPAFAAMSFRFYCCYAAAADIAGFAATITMPLSFDTLSRLFRHAVFRFFMRLLMLLPARFCARVSCYMPPFTFHAERRFAFESFIISLEPPPRFLPLRFRGCRAMPLRCFVRFDLRWIFDFRFRCQTRVMLIFHAAAADTRVIAAFHACHAAAAVIFAMLLYYFRAEAPPPCHFSRGELSPPLLPCLLAA